MRNIRLGLASIALAISGCTTAGGGFPAPQAAYDGAATAAAFSAFAPNGPDAPGARIDYGDYDQLLQTIVFDVGPSERTAPPKPLPMTGSRVQRQNTSRYRLEGNRIAFSIQPKALETVTAEIVDSFTALANSDVFLQMTSDQQLTFWLNFHNALLINQMAAKYPFQSLRALEAAGSGESVYEAKLTTVRGAPLSLNDIRHGIVYRYWKDPMTIYGFFLGTVGGPNIRTRAFNDVFLQRQLERNGRQFVNSLRGVENLDSSTRVSLVYKDALGVFDGSTSAMLDHIESLATVETKRDIFSGAGVYLDVYDWTVADLSYGDMPPPIGNFQQIDGDGLKGVFDKIGLSPQAQEFIRQVETKKIRLFRRRGGDVSITDVTPPTEAGDDGAAEPEAAADDDGR
ncbi:MAG: DUF547 domain-containing protein [Pseudomonadota bacterium]